MRTLILLVWGEHDPYGSPAIGRRAVQRLPEARLEVMPGAHGPFLDDPERVARLIDGFDGARTPGRG